MIYYDKIIYVIQKLFKILDGVDSEVHMFGKGEYMETSIPNIHLNEGYMDILIPMDISKTADFIIDIHESNSLYIDVGYTHLFNMGNIEIDPYQDDTIKKYSELYELIISMSDEEFSLYLKLGGNL